MKKAISALLVLTFLLASQAAWVSASETGHHHNKTVSPFNQNSQRTSLHCFLNKHQNGLFCPHESHMSSKAYVQGIVISTHCGGNSNKIPDAITISQELPSETTAIFQAFRFDQSSLLISVPLAIHKFRFLDFLDPPPRLT